LDDNARPSETGKLGLDAGELARVKECAGGDLRVLGLRFTNDRGCPTRAHAVLTVDVVDEPGHPTRQARDRVVAFLDDRLH
jgi:hypothetical protein